ncbi:MAG: UDP-N-acetylmuramate dehydrogenase [Muribaculaceae bacterium]
MFEYNKDLSGLTSFHIPAKAKLFAEYSSLKELVKISRSPEFSDNEVLHIGGGSNLLFVSDFDGLVLHSAIKGISRYDKDSETAFVIAGAGEKWADLVDWCVGEGLAGMENLAGIPGEVGASPVQNIGAYGVEAKDIIHNVECFDTATGEVRVLTNKDCEFAYRDSRFKHEWKGRYYVLRVSFRLRPSAVAENLEYGPLRELESRLGHTPTIAETATEVIRIRNSKLPDPAEIGSVGSFFKNPIVNRYFYEQEMLKANPGIPCYNAGDDSVKVPAGWLIEHSGLKGAKIGGAYVYPKQCLVIANDGHASSRDVTELADKIISTVNRKMGVILHPEVNYIDTDISVTVLGSGTSKGVPEVGCGCDICRSPFKKDKRTRASVLVKTHGMNILIDPSPDFRSQALANDISDIDAVLITHSHYDHVGGFDDLRPFCGMHEMPVYLKADVNSDLHHRLDYCFREHPYPGVPTFDMHEVGDRPFFINGLKVTPISVLHGKLPILGYRIGDFAYITDAKTIPEEEIEKLKGLKVLILNALRPKHHFAHLSFDEAIDLIGRICPEETYLTHFNHEAGFHHELEYRFGPHIHPAYDGMTIKVS